MHRKCRIGLIMLLLGGAACSAFGAGSSESEETPPAPDAATPDAMVDGGDSRSDAVAPEPCPAGAFCDDFERETVAGGWQTGFFGDGGVTIALDGTQVHGGTRSLLAASSGTGEGGAFLYRVVTGAPRKITLALWVYAEADVSKNFHYVTVAFANRSWIYVIQNANGLALAEQINDGDGGIPFNGKNAGAPAKGKWDFQTLSVDLDAARATLETARAKTTLDFTFPHDAFGDVEIGAPFTFAQTARLWIDDVQIR